jgi:hypothetical protein
VRFAPRTTARAELTRCQSYPLRHPDVNAPEYLHRLRAVGVSDCMRTVDIVRAVGSSTCCSATLRWSARTARSSSRAVVRLILASQRVLALRTWRRGADCPGELLPVAPEDPQLDDAAWIEFSRQRDVRARCHLRCLVHQRDRLGRLTLAPARLAIALKVTPSLPAEARRRPPRPEADLVARLERRPRGYRDRHDSGRPRISVTEAPAAAPSR